MISELYLIVHRNCINLIILHFTSIVYLFDIEREEHIQEQNLVAPDNALLLGLLGQPLGPLVGHVAHLSVRVKVVIMELMNKLINH